MKYGTRMTTGAILMAFVAAAPLAAGAADEKVQTTTQAAKTMVSDSWLTSKTKISLFADVPTIRTSRRPSRPASVRIRSSRRWMSAPTLVSSR
jgi:hypothetical protein